MKTKRIDIADLFPLAFGMIALIAGIIITIVSQVNTTYNLNATVTAIDTKNNIVSIVDTNGEEWEYYGVNNWTVGDTCNLTMDTNNTEDIHDDIITEITR